MEWSLRPLLPSDRVFALQLHEAAMRPYVEELWGWDEERQLAFFDEHFRPVDGWWVICADGEDVGRLVVDDRGEELYLAEIEVLPDWQGRGLGSAVIASVLAGAGKPVVLRVLHVNVRARALYERLGF